jgi:hypothetical protein
MQSRCNLVVASKRQRHNFFNIFTKQKRKSHPIKWAIIKMGNLETNTGLKIVINYFDKTALISTAAEAVEFINGLQYYGNSHSITCNQQTKETLNNIFNGENLYSGKPFQDQVQLQSSGCGSTYIGLYLALGATLEAHNEKVKENKEAQAKQDIFKENERFQAHMDEMLEPSKGWYIVTVTGTAFKIRGIDGKVTKSVKVLAENKMDAYNKAVKNLEDNPPKNVSFWSYFENERSALIEYVGTWTDAAELEYGN